jgi:hypothetical protein
MTPTPDGYEVVQDFIYQQSYERIQQGLPAVLCISTIALGITLVILAVIARWVYQNKETVKRFFSA